MLLTPIKILVHERLPLPSFSWGVGTQWPDGSRLNLRYFGQTVPPQISSLVPVSILVISAFKIGMKWTFGNRF